MEDHRLRRALGQRHRRLRDRPQHGARDVFARVFVVVADVHQHRAVGQQRPGLFG